MNLETNPKLHKTLSKPNPRILTVVRDHMSGLLYSVPYLRALRNHFPHAHIELLANSYATTILSGCPYIDQIVPFFHFHEETSKLTQLKWTWQPLKAWFHLFGNVDIVVHFRNVGPATLLFCKLLGSPIQIGYEQRKYNNLLHINLGHEDVLLDSRSRNARVIEALGLPTPSTEMELWIAPSEMAWAKNFLHSHGWRNPEPLIVMHPGCHWGCNEWLVDRWSALGDKLLNNIGGQVVITGDSSETDLAQNIAKNMKSKPIIASGQTTLSQFSAILSQASLVVSVDTAPTQICQALSIPAVILMGAGNPKWNGPLPGEPMILLQNWDRNEEGTLPCDWAAGTCHGPMCRSRLVKIDVESVFVAAMTLLEKPITAYISGSKVIERLEKLTSK